jgi:uncharacterized protein
MLQLPAGLTAASVPPVPDPGPLAAFFWDAVTEHRLEILRCVDCGHYVHYPRPICDRCLGHSLRPARVSGRGTLYAYTEVMQAFHPYFVDKLPYYLAVVELEEEPGLKMTTNLVDVDEDRLRGGIAVEVAFTEVVPGFVLPMFRPAPQTVGPDPGSGETADQESRGPRDGGRRLGSPA